MDINQIPLKILPSVSLEAKILCQENRPYMMHLFLSIQIRIFMERLRFQKVSRLEGMHFSSSITHERCFMPIRMENFSWMHTKNPSLKSISKPKHLNSSSGRQRRYLGMLSTISDEIFRTLTTHTRYFHRSISLIHEIMEIIFFQNEPKISIVSIGDTVTIMINSNQVALGSSMRVEK